MMHTEMKGKIQRKYYKNVRQLTSSKMNDRNIFRAKNSRAVSLERYSTETPKWTKNKLIVIARKNITERQNDIIHRVTLADYKFQE